MKTFITPNYVFTPGAAGAGTVDLSSIANFDSKRLIAIINQTRGVTVYATGSANLKASSIVGSLITLGVSTSGHASTDSLQIIYEDLTALKVDGSAVTQPVAGTVAVSNFPTNQTVSGTVSISNLPATQNVGGTVAISNFPATQAVTAASLPLPTGAALESGNLATLVARTPALGQSLMATSQPVVIASDQSPVQINGANMMLSGSAAALNAFAIASTDVSSYENISIQVTGIFVATLTPTFSNDNVNWVAANVNIITNATTAPAQTITAVGIYNIPVMGKYFRVQATAYTSGTAVVAGWCSANAIVDMGMRNVAIASGTVNTVSTVTTVTSGNLGVPAAVADAVSAAITTTTTSATFAPTYGSTYQVNIPVTVVTGTTPTMDVQIQESADSGTNWYAVYDFPRITAVGSYNSLVLTLTGNRVRYVQTIAGTTPSFTRAINRLQTNSTQQALYRQMIDRTVVLTTLSSTTPTLLLQNSKNIQLVINIGAATTPPALQLQGSDDNGVTWYSLGTPLTAVASSTVQAIVTNVTPHQVRAIVTTAGVAVTAGYVLVRSF
jgi:hypothetical protein